MHPKLLAGMFFFFALGATGGVTSLLTSDRPIFERSSSDMFLLIIFHFPANRLRIVYDSTKPFIGYAVFLLQLQVPQQQFLLVCWLSLMYLFAVLMLLQVSLGSLS